MKRFNCMQVAGVLGAALVTLATLLAGVSGCGPSPAPPSTATPPAAVSAPAQDRDSLARGGAVADPSSSNARRDANQPSESVPSSSGETAAGESRDDPARPARSDAERAQRLQSFQALAEQPVETSADIQPDVDDAALAAAGIRKLTGRHLTLFTDLPPSDAVDELPSLFDAAVPLWCDYFNIEPDRAADWQMVGNLMRDKARFQRLDLLPDWLPPFLNGYQQGHQLWLYEQQSDYYRRHLLLHEGMHGFMARFVGGGGPPWYKEGIAELLATHVHRDGQLRLAELPGDKTETTGWGRIKIVRDEFAAGRAMSLVQIMQYGAQAHLRNEPYGWCWAACAFFDGHPRYSQRFRQLPSDARDESFEFSRRFQQSLEDDWPLLNHEWHWYLANLDYGYDLAREAIEPRPAVPLDPAGKEVEIVADRGWQSTGIRLEAGRAYQLSAAGRYQVDDRPSIWWCEPNGITIRYVRGLPLGMLLAAVVDDSAVPVGLSPLASPMPVGLRRVLQPGSSGTLYLRINDSPDSLSNNAGSLTVSVAVGSSTPDGQ